MSAARRKGSRFESDVVAYLVAQGFPAAERRVMGGNRDRGDIAGVADWVLECKAMRELDLAGAMNEAKLEAANAGVESYAAILKRRNHPIAGAYVVLPLDGFVTLLHALRRAAGAEVHPRDTDAR